MRLTLEQAREIAQDAMDYAGYQLEQAIGYYTIWIAENDPEIEYSVAIYKEQNKNKNDQHFVISVFFSGNESFEKRTDELDVNELVSELMRIAINIEIEETKESNMLKTAKDYQNYFEAEFEKKMNECFEELKEEYPEEEALEHAREVASGYFFGESTDLNAITGMEIGYAGGDPVKALKEYMDMVDDDEPDEVETKIIEILQSIIKNKEVQIMELTLLNRWDDTVEGINYMTIGINQDEMCDVKRYGPDEYIFVIDQHNKANVYSTETFGHRNLSIEEYEAVIEFAEEQFEVEKELDEKF